MKNYVIAVMLFATTLCGWAQNTKEDRAAAKAANELLVAKMVAENAFAFRVDKASSATGTLSLQGNVGMTLSPTELHVAMPYNGSSSGAQWGNTTEDIMTFSSKKFTIDKRQTEGKKAKTEYMINAKRDDSSDNYKIVISIQPTGETMVIITPSGGSYMRYYGKITNS